MRGRRPRSGRWLVLAIVGFQLTIGIPAADGLAVADHSTGFHAPFKTLSASAAPTIVISTPPCSQSVVRLVCTARTSAPTIARPDSLGVDAPWSNLNPRPGPPPLAGAALTYDVADGYALLFGGARYANWVGSYPQTAYPVNYTWSFDALQDSWTNRTTMIAPPASDQWAMAYDPVGGYVVAFGGGTNQTWTYGHGQWRELHPAQSPSARFLPCMSQDSEDGYVLMFGGSLTASYSTPLNDTWSFSNGSWTNRTISPSPPGGAGCSMTDDRHSRWILELGGFASVTGSAYGTVQAWSYAAGRWAAFPAVSNRVFTPRWSAMLSYIPKCDCDMLFGGVTYDSTWSQNYTYVLGDTWLFQNRSQVRVSQSVSPSPRAAAGFALDPASGNVTLSGGVDSNGPNSETWSYSYPIALVLSSSSQITVDVGQDDNLSLQAIGGQAPLIYSWRGLPIDCGIVLGTTAYCRAGAPSISLVIGTATDSKGYYAVLRFNLTINPTLSLTATSSVGSTDVRRVVQFTANASGGSPPYAYWWNFSDGEFDTNASVLHLFAAQGVDVVTVTVVDTVALANYQSVLVNIASPPSIAIESVPANPTIGTPVTVTATVVGGTGPFQVRWMWGDGESATGPSATHVFSSAGRYTVSASVADGVGSSASTSTVVTVASSSALVLTLPLAILFVGAVAFAVVAATSWAFCRPRFTK